MMLNPVLRREARTSLRNWKIYGVISVYVLLVAGAAALLIWGVMYNSYNFGFDPQNIIQMYTLLSGFQLGLVLITTPALTAGAISGERERQTLDLLLVTKMTPFSIVAGKLFSCLGLIILMTVATLPIFALIFYFGGISFLSLLGMTGFLLIVSFMAGAISIFFSAVFRKTVASMVLVYILIGFLCGATVFGYAIYSTMMWSMYNMDPSINMAVVFLAANPIVGFISIIDTQLGTNVSYQLFNVYSYATGQNQPIPFAVSHFWAVNCIVNILIALLFLFLAAKMIQRVKK